MKNLKNSLYSALSSMGKFENSVFLNYPNYLNIGDHFIFLGTLSYLINTIETNINYIADMNNFSEAIMKKQDANTVILIQGGGSLGDVWYQRHQFHEYIISKYQDHKIIILPQTIYFRSKERLKKTANIFNGHKNLILFVRDRYSYDLASHYFNGCQVFLSPDMAFELLEMPGFDRGNHVTDSILFLSRKDKEINQKFSPRVLKIPNLVIEDWVSSEKRWKLGNPNYPLIQSIAQLYREIWQRGLLTPKEWIHRQQWQSQQIKNYQLDSLNALSKYYFSLSLVHAGIYQLQKYRLIITNRLHGHILCILLGIPHIFLPNSYYKNQGFYESWTNNISFCRFIEDTAKIENAIQELLRL
jgi:pyruvyl transferase EpsO